MAHLDMHVFLCRTDNIGCLIHDHGSGATTAIDAPEAAEIERQLRHKGWQLTHVFITHHHSDHTDGNLALKRQFGCQIIGPGLEAEKIPGLAKKVAGGDIFVFAGREVRILATPGHTKGHIAYYLPADHSVFVGDTLFAMGCGRVIEGSMDEMWTSLDQFRKLPSHTSIYCGHEYTLNNARFGLSVEPGNRALEARAEVVARERAGGRLTVPTTIGEELKTNVFLRPDSLEIRRGLGLDGAPDSEVFAELRRRKDAF